MSQDLSNSGISRRSIAKGAAWAVPAVTIAGAAPSLAASPLPACGNGKVNVKVRQCGFLDVNTPLPYFEIRNPAGSGCTLPIGTVISLSGRGLLGLNVNLQDLNGLNADVLFSDKQTAVTTRAIAPGEALDVKVFPSRGLAINAVGRYRLNVGGATGTFRLLFNVGQAIVSCIG